MKLSSVKDRNSSLCTPESGWARKPVLVSHIYGSYLLLSTFIYALLVLHMSACSSTFFIEYHKELIHCLWVMFFLHVRPLCYWITSWNVSKYCQVETPVKVLHGVINVLCSVWQSPSRMFIIIFQLKSFGCLLLLFVD